MSFKQAMKDGTYSPSQLLLACRVRHPLEVVILGCGVIVLFVIALITIIPVAIAIVALAVFAEIFDI